MSAPGIYLSTHVGAPVLQGGPSSLLDLLDACLRTGYGGAFSTGTITSSGVTPSDGDTVTVGGTTYTFKTALTPAANEVLIAGSAANALANLTRAINRIGTPGTDYGSATVKNPDVIVTAVTATVVSLQARYSGNDNDRGGSIALSKVAATLTVSGATLSGGTQGKATAVLTSDTTNPANNDQVVIGNRTYTFKTTLTGAADEVLIDGGGDADKTLNNLRDAINGTSGNGSGGGAGSEYGTGTAVHTQVASSAVSAHAITLTALYYGTAPNSYATTETSAHLSFGGSVLSGGHGQDPQAWTRPFTGTDIAVYKQPSGSGFYMRVNDAGPGAGTWKEARLRGWEVKADANDTADASNTGPFPTAAQLANGVFIRKSNTADVTARSYVVAADSATLYVMVNTGDIASTYLGFMFGDVYSFVSADAYKCQLIGRVTENTGAASNDTLPQIIIGFSGLSGHYIARQYTGAAGSHNNGKAGATAFSGAIAGPNAIALQGVLPPPNLVDGGFYISPVWAMESANNAVRGRYRGFWHFCHVPATVADGDTWTAPAGSPWAGRSFLVVKLTDRTSASALTGVFLIETTAWDTSS